MAKLFDGFIPSHGKAPLYSVKTYDYLQSPPERGDYVGVLKEQYIQVDIDDAQLAEKVFDMLRNENVKCDVLKTTRGLHFYFKNTKVKSQSVHYYSACGIPCDYGLGSKKRVVPLRHTSDVDEVRFVNGEEIHSRTKSQITREWLQTYDEVDYLPPWLFPITAHDYGIMAITTRNQTLFNYILCLQQKGLSKPEVRTVINIINQYMLTEPLSQKEIDVITRDDAFTEDLFFDEDGKFMHNVFGNYLLNNANVVNIESQCSIYTPDGLYTNDPSEFEKRMIQKIPSLKDQLRKEVYKYMTLKCERDVETADPKYIGLKESILDLETMEDFPYNPAVVMNNKINVEYNPDAYFEPMDKTLDKVCCNDPQIRALLEEMFGYTLYRSNKFQVCFVLTGEGSNGKSTILNCLKRLLGKANFTTLDLRELEETFKPSELYGKLANLGDDISAKYMDNSSVFKKCVTGEGFMVQKKYAQPFVLESYATQIFCANELPQVNDRTDGFSRRIILVPFRAKFSRTDSDYDPFIESKLLSEESMQYLLKLAINGLRRVLTNNGFTKSDLSEVEKQDYMKLNNNVLEWFDSEPKIENECMQDVYTAYSVWCVQSGCNPVKKLNLSKEIRKLYDTKVIRTNGKSTRVYVKLETSGKGECNCE